MSLAPALPPSAARAPRRFGRVVLALVAVALLGACVPGPAIRSTTLYPIAASPLPGDERQALARRAFAYDQLLMQGNPPALRQFHPPRMADALAADNERALARMIQASDQAFGDTVPGVLVVGRMRVDRAGIGTTDDGTPFALIPTLTLIAFGRPGGSGASTVVQGVTLAFHQDGQWYFLRLTSAQTNEALRRAYPQFRGVPLPYPAGDA
ncbi:MAG: hypothetical protein Q4G14_03440 [Paracoccus sp. (in: a-proteobacteria)]|uniref:hypothetical protein n=1 Tax=Paracoccus sp. TaxID=267 RepID=UPI0026E0E7FC|nr:hypothetical protein [Paracoccus sp. (in: a-proteobacteria)]MDO5612280.1 hypothetical protein [Paracoccus sp. (in: a-proteobacteria)]